MKRKNCFLINLSLLNGFNVEKNMDLGPKSRELQELSESAQKTQTLASEKVKHLPDWAPLRK